jgi:hypothetical protein
MYKDVCDVQAPAPGGKNGRLSSLVSRSLQEEHIARLELRVRLDLLPVDVHGPVHPALSEFAGDELRAGWTGP